MSNLLYICFRKVFTMYRLTKSAQEYRKAQQRLCQKWRYKDI